MGKLKMDAIVGAVIATTSALAENDDFKKMLVGTYSDGRIRNIPDAIHGELYSPKQKQKLEKRIKKRKKKKKKSYKKFKKKWGL